MIQMLCEHSNLSIIIIIIIVIYFRQYIIFIHTCIQYVHRVILFIIMVLKKPLYGVRLKMHGVAVQGT